MVLDSSSVDEQVCAAKDAYEKALSSKIVQAISYLKLKIKYLN